MTFLHKPLHDIWQYRNILENIKHYSVPINVIGPSDSQKVHLSCGVCSHTNNKAVFVTCNEMQARRMFEDFSFFMGEDVIFFPSREITFHDVEARSNDAIFLRQTALARIIEGNYKVVVTSAEAVIQKLISKEYFQKSVINIHIGSRIDIALLTEKLVEIGYERADVVDSKARFAVRGGIIDIFPVNGDSAVRIELFDDEVDSIRRVDVISQRSVEMLSFLRVVPACEIIYSMDKVQEISNHIRNDLIKISDVDWLSNLKKKVDADIEKISSQHYFPGIDRYIPYLIDVPSSITDYLTSQDIIFIDEPARFEQRIESLILEHYEMCKGLLEKGQILPGSFEVLFDFDDLAKMMSKNRNIYLNTMAAKSLSSAKTKDYHITSKLLGTYQGHINLLIDDIKIWKEKKYRIVILSGTRKRGERFSEELMSAGIESVFSEDYNIEMQPGQVIIIRGSLNKGFEYPEIGFVLLSDSTVFGHGKKPKKVSRDFKGDRINVFTDLKIGDYVVHKAHGIGQYVGIEKLTVEGIIRDYIKIKYLEGGYLYIPTNQLDAVQKYIGAEGKTPRLNKLGGADWSKTKKRVKESLRDLAGELIKLYAQRQSVKGFAFSKDTIWQRQFEEMFSHEETDDQLKCIAEIKLDMESDKVMDRLLCGDVGYGKTEVAARAIFKAAMDGKQVAYLVPTTILAQQQYYNFKERMSSFPMVVEVMSRFITKAEQKKILKNVKSGNVDVLIGTHRLLQKDVHFKDLGMLVIDEEQRFGVAHKEKIKNLKPNVDVLTLTATPIPRTLHMSLVGIRNISVIEDPPEERYPVQTYVMEYDRDVIRDAIMREIARNGQVFYLYNRVRTIDLKASDIQSLVPDAKIAVAHGQMGEKQLEDIMFSFINEEFDILVCTTIIESGLDMPNVNTIIVEDADRMGLAQLYQLRGRVGRSNRLAYAYITYRKDKIVSEIAEKRLQAIKEFTDFGSGFKIAMRDMEIRGAGNLLGPEQHGNMESVGYDMYCKLLNEAIKELKGVPVEEEDSEVAIDMNINAYIDDSYINLETQKIEMYKKIASAADEEDIADIEDELIDRYGDLPQPVKNLLSIASIKITAGEAGFSSVTEKEEGVIFQFKEGRNIDIKLIGNMISKHRRRLLFNAGNSPYLLYRLSGADESEILNNIKIILHDIKNYEV
jgi:transcription-repair coupling factor (superfamily II helicase)